MRFLFLILVGIISCNLMAQDIGNLPGVRTGPDGALLTEEEKLTGKFLFEAEDLEKKVSNGQAIVRENEFAGGGKWLICKFQKTGYLEFTLKGLETGYYNIDLRYRTSSLNAVVITSVDGRYIGQQIKMNELGKPIFRTAKPGEFYQPAGQDSKLRFTIIGSTYDDAYIQLDAIKLTPVEHPLTIAPNPLPEPGAGTAPKYALPEYDPKGGNIPADALDKADYPSLEAWLNDMEAKKKPGKVGSGTYHFGAKIFPENRRLTQSIYGYDSGQGKPVFDMQGRGTLFYLSNSNITIQYIHIKNTDYAFVGIDSWKDWRLGVLSCWKSWAYNSKQRKDYTYDRDFDNIRLMDCNFTNTAVAMMIVQEFHGMRNVHIGRNHSEKGKGFVTIRSYDFDNIFFYQNVLKDHVQKKEKGNYLGTLFMLGTNRWHGTLKNRNIFVEHNEATNYQSSHSYPKVNSSVFADVRDCSNVSISYNKLKDLNSTMHHSDCNAVYSKSVELVIRGNYFENCGSNSHPTDMKKLGSEGGCLTLKGGHRKGAKFGTIVEDCTFVAGSITAAPMVLFCHTGVLRNCTFKDWKWSGKNWKRKFILAKYAGGPLTIINPTVINCGNADKDCYLLHSKRAEAAFVDLKGIDFKSKKEFIGGGTYMYNCTDKAGKPLKTTFPQ